MKQQAIFYTAVTMLLGLVALLGAAIHALITGGIAP